MKILIAAFLAAFFVVSGTAFASEDDGWNPFSGYPQPAKMPAVKSMKKEADPRSPRNPNFWAVVGAESGGTTGP